MTLNLTADEVLTSTRSVRKRLDFEKPVPREVIMECLDLALQAPTGSNNQGWQFVFVEDEAKKKALADIYRTNGTPYLAMDAPQRGDMRDDRAGAVKSSGKSVTTSKRVSPRRASRGADRRDRPPAGRRQVHLGDSRSARHRIHPVHSRRLERDRLHNARQAGPRGSQARSLRHGAGARRGGLLDRCGS